MTYELGIDLGTTWTAAAVFRGERAVIVNLGTRQAAVPSVVYVGADGSVLVGEAAERRVLTEPERVARQFKRRIGDPAPILLGGSPHSAELLTSKLLRWVVDAVASREGEMPTTITITHPANWGAYKKDLLEQAVHLAGLSGPGNPTIRLLSEPEAAAIHYASTERVEPGQAVAVYDLGGGTFDVAILRATGDSFAILGAPEGIERLGGIDFDAAVLGHVSRTLGGLDELDPDDPTVATAVAHLRDQCTAAKEALSTDTQTIVPVMLPGRHTEVRLTRSELEAMVRPALDETIAATTRALRTAGLQASDLRRDRPRRWVEPHPTRGPARHERARATCRGRHRPEARDRSRCRSPRAPHRDRPRRDHLTEPPDRRRSRSGAAAVPHCARASACCRGLTVRHSPAAHTVGPHPHAATDSATDLVDHPSAVDDAGSHDDASPVRAAGDGSECRGRRRDPALGQAEANWSRRRRGDHRRRADRRGDRGVRGRRRVGVGIGHDRRDGRHLGRRHDGRRRVG